jgi:hypothetical protein
VRRRLHQAPANQRHGLQICFEAVGVPSQPYDSHQNPRLEHQIQQRQHHQPIHDHPGLYGEVDSNRSDQANASLPHTEISASSFDSGSTNLLARQRLLTRGALTPTSSEASHKGYEDNTIARGYISGIRAEQYATVNCKVTILLGGVCKLILPVSSPINEALQGLETPLPHRTKFPVVPESSPSLRLSQLAAISRPLPSYGEPWNTLQFRFENPGVQRVRTTGDSGEGASTRRGGGRRQPLTPDQKEKANERRRKGACLRCRLYKETVRGNASEIFGTTDTTLQCSGWPKCDQCSGVGRIWKLGCVRGWPKDRWNLLQPEQLVAHLRRNNFENFINQNTYNADCSSPETFELQLTLEIGRPFHLRIIGVVLYAKRLIERDVFRSYPMTEDYTEYVCIDELDSPPILPAFTFEDGESKQLREEIMTWLEEILHDPKLRTDTFPSYCFWTEDERWQRKMFTAICEYYNANLEEHAVLKDALTFALLNYLMTKSLVVPEDRIGALFSFLQDPNYGNGRLPKKCSPLVVNRFVKILMYETVEAYAKKTLVNLESILREKGESGLLGHKKDLFFSLSFILLMVLARNQIMVISRAVVTEKRRDEGCTMEEAKGVVKTMELEFADHVIGLCQYWYDRSQRKTNPVTNGTKDAELYSTHFGLLERVQRITTDESEWFLFNLPSLTVFGLTKDPSADFAVGDRVGRD